MQRKIRYPIVAAAMAAMLIPACYVTTSTDPQAGGAQTAPPRTRHQTPDQGQTAPNANNPQRPRPPRVRDRRGRIGGAAAFAIEPTAGPVGTAVNIYGRFVGVGRAGGPVMCTFAGAQAVSPYYVSVRRMILLVPEGARTGPVRCTVGKKQLWAGKFAVTPKLDDIFLPTTEDQGLLGAVYRIPPNTQKLPDFASLGEPFATFVMPALQVLERDFKVGFPGLSDDGKPLLEWFAIRFVGQIEATRSAEYTFRMTSDDGAKLYIDDQMVIANDGVHPAAAKEGVIELSEGKHDIVVEYFQGPRYKMALLLQWKRGNNPFSAVPAKSLSRYTGEADCSERPAVFCCQAQTPQCQDCKVRAQVVLDNWQRQCVKGGQ